MFRPVLKRGGPAGARDQLLAGWDAGGAERGQKREWVRVGYPEVQFEGEDEGDDVLAERLEHPRHLVTRSLVGTNTTSVAMLLPTSSRSSSLSFSRSSISRGEQ